MTDSLRQFLNNEIKTRGFLSLGEVHAIANDKGHKESNAERRLRPSESPDIETEYNDKGQIVGYHWKAKPLPDLTPRICHYIDLWRTTRAERLERSFLLTEAVKKGYRPMEVSNTIDCLPEEYQKVLC